MPERCFQFLNVMNESIIFAGLYHFRDQPTRVSTGDADSSLGHGLEPLGQDRRGGAVGTERSRLACLAILRPERLHGLLGPDSLAVFRGRLTVIARLVVAQ